MKLAGSVEPARASAGQVVTVSFRMEIAGRWHVAAAGGKPGPEAPLFLRLALAEGMEPVGEWTMPAPTLDAAGHARYEGSVEFRHQVHIKTDAALGRANLSPSAYLQACDPTSCRPPVLRVVDVPLEVVAP